MENASKALLIAGAILLVIAIIAIAVGIVSRTRGTIDEAGSQIDIMAVQMHNSIFQKYEGDKKTYAEVKEYISEIIAYDNSQKNKNLLVTIANYYYTDSNHTNMKLHCTPSATAYGEWIGCDLLRSSKAINKLWDVSVEYNSGGIINRVNFIRYDNEI